MLKEPTLIACHQCDLLYQQSFTPRRGTAVCRRCGAVLLRVYPHGVEWLLALSVSGIILMIAANVLPLVSMRVADTTQEATLTSGIWLLALDGMPFLAMLILLTGVVLPGLKLFLLIIVLIPLGCGSYLPGQRAALYLLCVIRPWAMQEVFLLGVLICIVKLADSGTIILGPAMAAFVLLTVVLIGVNFLFTPYALWQQLETRCLRK